MAAAAAFLQNRVAWFAKWIYNDDDADEGNKVKDFTRLHSIFPFSLSRSGSHTYKAQDDYKYSNQCAIMKEYIQIRKVASMQRKSNSPILLLIPVMRNKYRLSFQISVCVCVLVSPCLSLCVCERSELCRFSKVFFFSHFYVCVHTNTYIWAHRWECIRIVCEWNGALYMDRQRENVRQREMEFVYCCALIKHTVTLNSDWFHLFENPVCPYGHLKRTYKIHPPNESGGVHIPFLIASENG